MQRKKRLERKTALKRTGGGLKRTPLNRVSKKTRKLQAAAKPIRDELVAETGECMLCGTTPKKPRWPIKEHNQLCCHEILPGPLRQRVLDVPSCLLVVCWHCNTGPLEDKAEWPLVRQLAVIKAKAPERYDLQEVLAIRNPRAMEFITEEDVDVWVRKDWC